MTFIQLGFLTVVAIVLAMTVIKPLLTRRNEESSIPGLALATEEGGTTTLDVVGGLTPEEIASLPTAGEQTAESVALEQLDPDLPAGEALRNIISDRPEQSVQMLKSWLEEPALEPEQAQPAREIA